MYKRVENIKYNSGYKDGRKCFIAECAMPARTRSLCNKHAKQIANYGHIFTDEELHEMASHKASTRKWLSHNWSEEAKKRHSERTKGKTFNTGRTHFKRGAKAWNKGLKNWVSDKQKAAIKTANTKYTDEEKLTNKQLRARFRRIKSQVLQRDNYTCQICDNYGVPVQVDHIKTWAEHPELRFELDNCRTLCMPCHYYVTYKKKLTPGTLWGHNKENI